MMAVSFSGTSLAPFWLIMYPKYCTVDALNAFCCIKTVFCTRAASLQRPGGLKRLLEQRCYGGRFDASSQNALYRRYGVLELDLFIYDVR